MCTMLCTVVSQFWVSICVLNCSNIKLLSEGMHFHTSYVHNETGSISKIKQDVSKLYQCCAHASSCQGQFLCILTLARLESVVGFMCFCNDFESELLVLRLVIVAKLVLGFAIWCLVIAKPHTNLLKLSRKFSAAACKV